MTNNTKIVCWTLGILSSNSKKKIQKIKITSSLEATESLLVLEYPDLADTAGPGGVNSAFPHPHPQSFSDLRN